MKSIFAAAALASASLAAPIFQEDFNDSSWAGRWIKTSNSKFTGLFKQTAGKYYGDKHDQQGIQTSEDARHYGYSAKFAAPFDNKDKTLVLQMTVKHEQKLDCGGSYIKLLPAGADQTDFNNDSEYSIMFGPDVCGPSNRKIHLIFNYKGQNLLWKKQPACKTDNLTHLYTAIIRPDGTYEVLVDNEKVESGNLEDDWDFLKPKKIKDPSKSKPADWVDNPKIADPSDTKPADWDKPATIPDPDAKKPDDWDDDDGVWEPPMIPNPEHKGEWKPRQIDNPDYKGPWVHPEIDNPEYVADKELYHRGPMGLAAFEIWQVTSGTIFDNILVTTDEKEAREIGDKHWKAHKDAEEKAFKELEEEQKKKEAEERKKKEEEAKAAKKDDDDDEDDDKDDGKEEL